MTNLEKDSFLQAVDGPPNDSAADQQRLGELRALELELERTRREAHAARLDARAVELEMRIRELARQLGIPREDFDVSRASGLRKAPEPPRELVAELLHAEFIPTECKQTELNPRSAGQSTSESGNNSRGQSTSKEARMRLGTNNGSLRNAAVSRSSDPAGDIRRIDPPPDQPNRSQPKPVRIDRPRRREGPAAPHFASIEPVDSEAAVPTRRRRRGALVSSVLVHVAVVAMLALMTLSVEPPGDQIAIAGSVSQEEGPSIESIKIESPQTPPTSSPDEAPETPAEISEFGEIPIGDMITEVVAKPEVAEVEPLAAFESLTAAAMSLQLDSQSTMQFCGLDGGGSHFVYLVDSSGSMGDAFESARVELLRSIDLLKSDQRFYVIFFDAESDYMRLTSEDRDEPHSLPATPENKNALRRWAMTIRMDRGRAPYDALEFAVELRPDVIFLLSDGEFPKRIEELLQETNRTDNLFGDDDPLSIVHTIGYHSREGEQRMRRIAAQNGGMYRYVPKPQQD